MFNKSLKKKVLTIIGGLAVVAMAFVVTSGPVSAAGTNMNSRTNLEDLIVLDSLFGNDGSDFGELIILSELFGGGALLGQNTVVVQSGDTLRGIAARELGNAERYREIANMNNIANPNLIYPGQVLTLPRDSGTGGGILNRGDGLGDLIILNELFSDNGDNGDGLFNDNGSSNGDKGLFDGSFDLEKFIIFDTLFNDNSSGMTSGFDLRDYILFDKLFSDDE